MDAVGRQHSTSKGLEVGVAWCLQMDTQVVSRAGKDVHVCQGGDTGQGVTGQGPGILSIPTKSFGLF
jgi:hypothetical protein